MPSLYDALTSLIGRQDPIAQLAAGTGQGLNQAGSPVGPQPLAGGAAPPSHSLAASMPTPTPGPAGWDPSVGQPPPQQGPPPQQQGPQAYQSPQDMQQMYGRLMQQQMGNEMFNRGMANFVAGFSPLSQRASIASNFDQGPDAGSIMGNIMKLQGWQQQQNQVGAFQRSAPDIAKQLGMTTDQVLADPQGAMQASIAAKTPTDAIKNWTQIRQTLRDQGLSEDDINIQAPPSIMMGAGLANLGDRQFLIGQQQAIADNKKNGTPIPPQFQGDLANYQAVMQAHAKLLGDQANDLAESQGKFGDQTAKMNEVERITNSIQNATEKDGTSVLETILNNPVKKAAAVGLMNASGDPGFFGSGMQQVEAGRLTPEEQTAVANLKQLTSSTYATAFTSTGSRRTQQEVQNITASLSQLGNLNQPYGSYKASLDNLHKLNQVGTANAYGAAQRLDEVPDNLKPLVNPIYLPAQFDAKGNQVRPKGPLYTGAGGDWATKAAPPQAAVPTAPADRADSLPPDTSVKTPEDVAKLPKGRRFVIPDGSGRIGVAPGS